MPRISKRPTAAACVFALPPFRLMHHTDAGAVLPGQLGNAQGPRAACLLSRYITSQKHGAERCTLIGR